jgi:hypothetical protein
LPGWTRAGCFSHWERWAPTDAIQTAVVPCVCRNSDQDNTDGDTAGNVCDACPAASCVLRVAPGGSRFAARAQAVGERAGSGDFFIGLPRRGAHCRLLRTALRTGVCGLCAAPLELGTYSLSSPLAPSMSCPSRQTTCARQRRSGSRKGRQGSAFRTAISRCGSNSMDMGSPSTLLCRRTCLFGSMLSWYTCAFRREAKAL